MHSTPNHFLAVIAFLLPPAAVWIKTGCCSADGGINLLLCLLGWVPGIAHAMYIVYRKKPYCVEEANQHCCHAPCSHQVSHCNHHAPSCNHHHHHVTHCNHTPIDQQPILQQASQQPTYQSTHQQRQLINRDSDSSDIAVLQFDGRTEVLPGYKG